MLVEWLYRTTLELSLLIGLVLLLRPLVRRTLGARAAYWLWLIPVIRAVLIDRPEWPRTLVESVGVPGGDLTIAIYPSPDVWVLPAGIPWSALWLSGGLLWIALRIAGAINFRRALTAESSALDLPAPLAALLPERLQRSGPRYFATDMPGTPFVTGLVRPLVHLPTDFFQRFSLEEQQWVIKHELTHAARGDLWVQAAWETLRAVFWFNPIVHLAAGAMRDDQELACDQAVLRGSSDEDRYAYGRALVVGAGAHLFPSLLNFFGNQRERIAMIRNHKASLRRDIVGCALCGLVGVFALTKAPESVAELVSEAPLTLNVRDLPVTKAVQLIADFSGVGADSIRGLDQLGDTSITARIENTPAREALQRILSCTGFTYRETENVVEIVQLAAPNPAAAGACSAGIERD
jgi:beta-lactamase regulating signal transducer with metallopeptidase domain